MNSPEGARTAHAVNILAPNPSVMTLDGTNTWVVGAGESVIVIDPGPLDEIHLRRVAAHVGDRRVESILLTHGHDDHSGGARRFAELTGAPVRAADPRHRLGEEGLAEGDVVAVGDAELHVYATPGHTFDSVCLWLPHDRALFTGDTVLGRGTTVIAPEGDLADYLRTLDRLRELVGSLAADVLLPGHGPVVADPEAVVAAYVAHRRERLAQIRAAQALGAVTPREVVEIVYADVDRTLWPAAEMSVRAQLAYLEGRSEAPVEGRLRGHL
ncbi:Glyoxylase, beta-lactamase superfamily II [Sinosporangium album]|uniref:Glyoxylase, beta-lactamase superfamily II n=1 Tax=Sinosporangium album TaxID=504805 RepID=A0A1G7U5E4_9ACTN|nr:MBL fold metallo-hydrolase [Sinosporangium album]SDG41980.1 Glyoxylase, beta-lactamase superfamily II [Sinosporangium album]